MPPTGWRLPCATISRPRRRSRAWPNPLPLPENAPKAGAILSQKTLTGKSEPLSQHYLGEQPHTFGIQVALVGIGAARQFAIQIVPKRHVGIICGKVIVEIFDVGINPSLPDRRRKKDNFLPRAPCAASRFCPNSITSSHFP